MSDGEVEPAVFLKLYFTIFQAREDHFLCCERRSMSAMIFIASGLLSGVCQAKTNFKPIE